MEPISTEHTISIDDIQAFPSSVLRLTEEVSSLLKDIQAGSQTLKASQIPLFMPRIEFLKKKLTRKAAEAGAMADAIINDERFKNDCSTITATLKQQLVIINRDLQLLDEVRLSLQDAAAKLKHPDHNSLTDYTV